MQTLRMLEESTALDELGIGVIRDAYSDILFPGISTLQTKAKYFVLIPYLFGMAERENFKRSADILPWLQRQEDLIVPVLMKNSNDITGIIGHLAHRRGKSVKAKPSGIYWNGMRTYEILRNDSLSISNVCNIIYGKQTRKNAVTIKTETKRHGNDGFDDETAINENTPIFSAIRSQYAVMSETGIDLTKEEAIFLYDKITKAQKSRDSLLAFMLREKLLFSDFDSINDSVLPNTLAVNVRLAKDFADFIFGAHICYNVIYSENMDADKINDYQKWQDSFDFNAFDISAVLSRVNCDIHTTAFLEGFYEAAKAKDNEIAEKLIINREKAKKSDRAKLGKPQEYRYDSGRPVHYYKLNYRYPTAKTIISDILSGLEG